MPGFLDDRSRKYMLLPLKYPKIYDHYLNGIRNNWTVEEVPLNRDIEILRSSNVPPGELRVLKRIIAMFATLDGVITDSVTTAYLRLCPAPEAAMAWSRQAFEECLHQQSYLTMLEAYVPDYNERITMFKAIEEIPTIRKRAEFCKKYLDPLNKYQTLDSDEAKKDFLLHLICVAMSIEGLSFLSAFAFSFFLRERLGLGGLGSMTNFIMRDESAHQNLAFDVIDIIKEEYPHLWTESLIKEIMVMAEEAIQMEYEFAQDALIIGVAGFTADNMLNYLKFVVDRHFVRLGIDFQYGNKNPFDFMMTQDIQEHTSFFERSVSAYNSAVQGNVSLDSDF